MSARLRGAARPAIFERAPRGKPSVGLMGVRTAHGTNLGATSGPSGAMGADTSYEVRLDRFAVLRRSRSIDARNLRPYVFHRDAAARFPCARGVAPRPLPCDSRRPTLTSPRPASRLADADSAQPGAPQGETGLLPAKDRLSRRLTGGGRGASPPFPDLLFPAAGNFHRLPPGRSPPLLPSRIRRSWAKRLS